MRDIVSGAAAACKSEGRRKKRKLPAHTPPNWNSYPPAKVGELPLPRPVSHRPDPALPHCVSKDSAPVSFVSVRLACCGAFRSVDTLCNGFDEGRSSWGTPRKSWEAFLVAVFRGGTAFRRDQVWGSVWHGRKEVWLLGGKGPVAGALLDTRWGVAPGVVIGATGLRGARHVDGGSGYLPDGRIERVSSR